MTADTQTTDRSNPNFIPNDLDRVPDKAFRDYNLDDRVVDALEAKGITHPFPIQELTLPVALGRNDIIGQARTGTGKTLGFGLPLIEQCDPDAGFTQALVVTPTRELCIQVYEELRIGEVRGLTLTTVYGGVGYEEQTEALTNGVHIVVGTPGRLLDMIGRGHLDLSRVKVVVLDEADEMLDMGFLPDVERILNSANSEGRHTMLFSATMPASVVKLARRYTDAPLFMGADTVEHETAPTVDQHFFQVFRMDKPRVLARILQQPDRENVYVFCRTKAMCDRLVRELDDLNVDAIAIHGDLRQAAREKNLDKFRDGRVNVLVATEVAARGIDVENVTHVVNYDLPDDEKMYLHRIGRTARAGNKGCAISFAEHNELARLKVIMKAVQQDGDVPEVFSTSDLLTELFELPDETPWGHLSKRGSGGSQGGGGGGRPSSRTRQDRRGEPHSSKDERDGGRDRDRQRSRDDRSRDTSSDRGGRDARGDRDRDQRSTRNDDGRDRSRDRQRSDEDRSSSRDRERTRERSRDRSNDRGSSSRSDDRQRTRTRSDDERSPRGGSRDGSSGRVRARGGKPVDDRDRSSRDRGDGGRTSGGDDRDRSRGSGGGSSRGSSNRSNRSGQSSNRGGGQSSDRSDRSNRGGGQGSDTRGGNNRGSGNSTRGGGSNNRGGGKKQGGGRGNDAGRVDLPSKVRPTRSGKTARGEGQPRLERRVAVEHLP